MPCSLIFVSPIQMVSPSTTRAAPVTSARAGNPDYGNISRAQDKRIADYADLFSDLQDDLNEIIGDVNGALVNISDMGQAAQGIIEEHEDTFNALESKYLSWISELRTVGKALYENYRQLNEEHRTEPLPAAFQVNFSLSDELAEPPVRPTLAKKQDMEHLRTLKDACFTIVAQFEYRFNRRYRLEDMVPRLAWAALRTPLMPYRLLKLAENSA